MHGDDVFWENYKSGYVLLTERKVKVYCISSFIFHHRYEAKIIICYGN